MAILKTNTAQQKALKMALEFIILNITNKQALRECYGLSYNTLMKIEYDNQLSLATLEKYMRIFVSVINDYRCRYREDSPRRKMARDFLADVLLAFYGVKTDSEKRE